MKLSKEQKELKRIDSEKYLEEAEKLLKESSETDLNELWKENNDN